MEKSNGGLDLSVVTNESFDTDDIKETIVKYGQNFVDIESYLKQTAKSPTDIAVGQNIENGHIIWNNNPTINSYVGWVNTRKGIHAPSWKPKENYTLGQIVRPITENGNVYICVSEGESTVIEPTFLVGKDAEFFDAIGYAWRPNYNYEVNDVVFAVDGSKLFFYICETGGITDVEEPVWTDIKTGTTVLDGSTVWRKEKTVKWKQFGEATDFRPFGKIE